LTGLRSGFGDVFAHAVGFRVKAVTAGRLHFVILQKRNEGLTNFRQFETDHDFDRFYS
jgi:hypothetical protein